MALLSPTTLESHPAGTTNLGGIINDNWAKINAMFDPDLDPGDPVYGLIAEAVRAQAGGVFTITYGATPNIDFNEEEIQVISLTGDAAFTFSNLGAGKTVRLLIACDGTARTLGWPTGVNWVGTAITTIDANAYLVVELISQGTTDTNVWATAGAGGTGGGGGGPAGTAYLWDTGTSGDPGTGSIGLNNATVASATQIRISETDNEGNTIDTWLATWDDSTGTVKGTIKVEDEADPTAFAIFDISGTITDSGTYDTFTATHIASGGTLANNAPVRVTFYRAGDAGSTGATGSPGAAGPAGVAGNLFLFDTATSGDPGTGEILFNNATLASVTAVHVSETDADANALGPWLDTIDDSTSTIKGTLVVRNLDDLSAFAIFHLTAMADSGAYRTLTVTHIASGGTFGAADNCGFQFIPTGDKGSAGDSSIHVVYEGPTAGDYTLVLYSGRAGTIDRMVTKTTSGTLTANLKINGVSVTSLSAVAVTSTLSNTAATGANTFVAGDTITITASSVAAAVNWAVSIIIS